VYSSIEGKVRQPKYFESGTEFQCRLYPARTSPVANQIFAQRGVGDLLTCQNTLKRKRHETLSVTCFFMLRCAPD
jgi:hypothetical protein